MTARYARMASLLIPAALLFTRSTAAADNPPTAAPAGSSCASVPVNEHPRAYITNGTTDLVVFLPDTEKGSYRAARFDWSGIVACASYKGHTYFGEWSNHTDPMGNDTVTGPAEEFRHPTSEIGYDDAKPGDSFLKIGAGMLKRKDDQPYKFGTNFEVVDHGVWKVKVGKREITFTQTLKSPLGYAYVYEKKLVLDAHAPVMTLEHKLKNTGTKALVTNVYDHDFFILDGKPTGPGMAVTFGFEPKPLTAPFPEQLVSLSGNELVFKDTPKRGLMAQDYLTGYTGKSGEYSVHLQDRNTQVGILQTSDSKIEKVYFWSTPKTICPEMYLHVDAQPGKSAEWKIKYQFEAPKS